MFGHHCDPPPFHSSEAKVKPSKQPTCENPTTVDIIKQELLVGTTASKITRDNSPDVKFK
jgi:hypothetical protein